MASVRSLIDIYRHVRKIDRIDKGQAGITDLLAKHVVFHAQVTQNYTTRIDINGKNIALQKGKRRCVPIGRSECYVSVAVVDIGVATIRVKLAPAFQIGIIVQPVDYLYAVGGQVIGQDQVVINHPSTVLLIMGDDNIFNLELVE